MQGSIPFFHSSGKLSQGCNESFIFIQFALIFFKKVKDMFVVQYLKYIHML